MMRLRLLILISLVLLPMQLFADDYGYPIEGPYEATIIGTPPSMIPVYREKLRARELVLDVLPEREKPPFFFYDKGLRCMFAYQKKKAPLVFLISGTGSSAKAPKLVTMMRALYHEGFHVITIPSPSHQNFIISASRNCVPGDLTEDAADLYHAMEVAWKEVQGDIEVSSFSLGGYSLGANQAAWVAKLDEERKVFNFRKVLMINPSVSLYSSVERIEDLLKHIPGGPAKEGFFFNRMLTKFSEYYRYGNFVAISDDFLYSMYRQRIFTNDEAGGLIGLTFRITLAGMIFAADVMNNSGYVTPKNRVLLPTDSVFDYFMVSAHLSYYDYFNEYFYPFFAQKRPGLTRDALIESESLKSIEGYLKSDKFGAMVNENDFILSADDVQYLKQLFGPRGKFYPRGGHLGNLEYRDNLAHMVEFFKQ